MSENFGKRRRSIDDWLNAARGKAMYKRIANACFLILLTAALPATGSARADWVQFAPPDRSFSVFLPAAPGPEQVSAMGGAMTSFWVLEQAGIRYMMAFSDYKS